MPSLHTAPTAHAPPAHDAPAPSAVGADRAGSRWWPAPVAFEFDPSAGGRFERIQSHRPRLLQALFERESGPYAWFRIRDLLAEWETQPPPLPVLASELHEPLRLLRLAGLVETDRDPARSTVPVYYRLRPQPAVEVPAATGTRALRLWVVRLCLDEATRASSEGRAPQPLGTKAIRRAVEHAQADASGALPDAVERCCTHWTLVAAIRSLGAAHPHRWELHKDLVSTCVSIRLRESRRPVVARPVPASAPTSRAEGVSDLPEPRVPWWPAGPPERRLDAAGVLPAEPPSAAPIEQLARAAGRPEDEGAARPAVSRARDASGREVPHLSPVFCAGPGDGSSKSTAVYEVIRRKLVDEDRPLVSVSEARAAVVTELGVGAWGGSSVIDRLTTVQGNAPRWLIVVGLFRNRRYVALPDQGPRAAAALELVRARDELRRVEATREAALLARCPLPAARRRVAERLQSLLAATAASVALAAEHPECRWLTERAAEVARLRARVARRVERMERRFEDRRCKAGAHAATPPLTPEAVPRSSLRTGVLGHAEVAALAAGLRACFGGAARADTAVKWVQRAVSALPTLPALPSLPRRAGAGASPARSARRRAYDEGAARLHLVERLGDPDAARMARMVIRLAGATPALCDLRDGLGAAAWEARLLCVAALGIAGGAGDGDRVAVLALADAERGVREAALWTLSMLAPHRLAACLADARLDVGAAAESRARRWLAARARCPTPWSEPAPPDGVAPPASPGACPPLPVANG